MTAGPPILEFDRDRLAGTRFTTVRTYAQLDSTNTALVEEARRGAPEGLVLVADHQTGGRGRLGRTWSAAPGAALLVSVLLRPPLPIDEVPVVLMAAGLAACDGVEAAAGFRPGLKWPNDLVVEDRKLAGLLTEATGGADPGIVLGLGINVAASAYPAELAGDATSCEEVASRPVDRAELLVAFLRALESRYATLLAGGSRDATRRSTTTGPTPPRWDGGCVSSSPPAPRWKEVRAGWPTTAGWWSSMVRGPSTSCTSAT